MDALGVMPLDKREASSEVSPVRQRKTYRAEIKQTTAVKPMSMLVAGFNRVALCELLLWQHWRENLEWGAPKPDPICPWSLVK